MLLRQVCIIIIFNFTYFPCVPAQNLLQNGSFEKHGSLDCLSCIMWADKFAAVLPPWRNVSGGHPLICDNQYKRDGVAIQQGSCPFDRIQPYAGNTMLEMEYSASCYDHDFKTRGCASYLGTALPAPLAIGQVYEVSFRIYILSSKDSTYAQRIGFNIYPDVIRNPTGRLLAGTGFLLDTVIYNRWYRVSWLLRPVCNLQFLVFGVFRGNSGPPVNGKGHHNRYYMDDVQILPVADNALANATPVTPYCRYREQGKEALSPEIKGVSCWFASNDSTLSAAGMAALDSFAVRAKEQPAATFTIAGHTDDVGANHQALSKARVDMVIGYLERKHSVPAFRFFQLYRGEADPTASNQAENGRQMNRRVDIRQADLSLDHFIYRQVLLHVFAGKKEEAFKLLAVWLRVTPEQKKIYLLFDPRLAVLQADRRWAALAVKKVRDSYRAQQNPRLAYLLDSLGKEDQKCRTLPYYVENLNAYMAVIDSTDRRFDVHYFPDTADHTCAVRDEKHFQYFKKIMGGQAWPKASEVGERAAKTAFLIVSHAGDTTHIAYYLPLLKQRCTEGEAEWLHYATLYDRLQVMRGLPQRFGTQYKPPEKPDGKLQRFPLEDAGKVHRWREELGIEPLSETDDGQ